MLYNTIAATEATEISIATASPVAIDSRTARSMSKLTEQGLVEAADLVGRMAARLMRQEQLLIDERARSAVIELQLAALLAERTASIEPPAASIMIV